MARGNAMYLLAFVCLLATSEWFMTVTSSTFIDAFSNPDLPLASRDSPESWREVLRLARVLTQPPRHDPRFYPSLERGILHSPYLETKRNAGYIDAILGMPDLMKQGKK